MFPIVSKRPLNEAGTVLEYVIKAPLVAKKCLPGQFIVLRLDEHGERVPLTIADYDRKAGTVTIIFQIVGGATMELNALNAGDSLVDFVGPLGTPSKLEGLKKVAVVGGGGQPVPVDASIRQKRREAIFNCDRTSELRKSHENPEIKTLYDTWLGKPLSEKAHSLLHTHYHAQNR